MPELQIQEMTLGYATIPGLPWCFPGCFSGIKTPLTHPAKSTAGHPRANGAAGNIGSTLSR